MNAPSFSVGDFSQQQSGDGSYYWQMSPEARARAAQWSGSDNPSNMFFDFQNIGPAYRPGMRYVVGPGDSGQGGYVNDTPEQWNQFNNAFSEGFGGRVKTGGKEATRYRWDRVGDQFVPREDISTERWDTNSGDSNKLALTSLAALVGGGLAYGALGGAAAGAGAEAGGAGAGASLGGASSIIDAGAVAGASESAAALWPGATGITAGTGSVGTGIGIGGAVAGSSLSDLARQAGRSIQDYVADPKNWSTIAKLGGLLGGALAGGAAGGNGGGSGNQPAIPVNTPALWGGADPSNWLGGGGYRPSQGPTQTQGMFNDYMAGEQRGLNVPGSSVPDAGMAPGARAGQGTVDFGEGLLGRYRTPPPGGYPKMQGLLPPTGTETAGMVPGAPQQMPNTGLLQQDQMIKGPRGGMRGGLLMY